MPPPTAAADDSLHRSYCCKTFLKTPPKPWEFLFYIPNPNHPIHDDESLSPHFCLVLPDDYKQGLTCKHSSSADQYRAVALVTRKPRFSKISKGYKVFKPHTARCTCPVVNGELETNVFDRNRGRFETWSCVVSLEDALWQFKESSKELPALGGEFGGLVGLEVALRKFEESPKALPLTKEEAGPVEKRKFSVKRMLGRQDSTHVGPVGKRKCSLKRMLGRHEVTPTVTK
ncbi:MAG: hypothetical protein Q9221_008628 [Calogaya cf. arnoldii]